MKLKDIGQPTIETRRTPTDSQELWEFRLSAIQTLSTDPKQAQRLWNEFSTDFESRASINASSFSDKLEECMWAFADREFYEAASGVQTFIQNL
jgi:hypothetical protein